MPYADPEKRKQHDKDYHLKHKTEHNKKSHDYYWKNRTKIREQQSNYFQTHKEQHRVSNRKSKKKCIIQIQEYNKNYVKNHPNQSKEWKKNHPEEWKKLRARVKAKRRGLGDIELNERFENCHGHHIDFEHVINIPKELHISISHNVHTGRNMELINDKAFEWLGQNT